MINIKNILLTLALVSTSTYANDTSSKADIEGFNKTLTLQGITFHVTCPNNSSLNQLTITPSGLEGVNETISKEIDGSVTGVEIADLNADGSPEIYVYVNSAGSGAYGSVVGYAANHKKSLSDIYMFPLSDDAKNSKGYMGHDKFSISKNVLKRSFPIYKKSDSNAEPKGGTRVLDYKLVAGEASWQLKVVKREDSK